MNRIQTGAALALIFWMAGCTPPADQPTVDDSLPPAPPGAQQPAGDSAPSKPTVAQPTASTQTQPTALTLTNMHLYALSFGWVGFTGDGDAATAATGALAKFPGLVADSLVVEGYQVKLQAVAKDTVINDVEKLLSDAGFTIESKSMRIKLNLSVPGAREHLPPLANEVESDPK